MTVPHDEFTKIDAARVPAVVPCPVCGSAAEAWRHTNEDGVGKVAISCSMGDAFGPQEGEYNVGCLLWLPPRGFFQARIKEAADYWNAYAKSLASIRRKNSWANHSAMREEQ